MHQRRGPREITPPIIIDKPATAGEIIPTDLGIPRRDDRYSTTTRSVDRARLLARALDSAVRIPGTNVRFGLDALLGLVPEIGRASCRGRVERSVEGGCV